MVTMVQSCKKKHSFIVTPLLDYEHTRKKSLMYYSVVSLQRKCYKNYQMKELNDNSLLI